MSDKRLSKEEDKKEIDFMSNPSLQLAIKNPRENKHSNILALLFLQQSFYCMY